MVKHLNNDEKIAAYKKLMRLRKIFILSFFLVPLVPIFLIIMSTLIMHPIEEDTVLKISPLIIFPIVFFNGMRLMAYDHCPWCKSSFFTSDSMGVYGASIMFRKKCSFCGEPKGSDSHP
jgi:archaellum biogenesis protein FlaJ (TadC family)